MGKYFFTKEASNRGKGQITRYVIISINIVLCCGERDIYPPTYTLGRLTFGGGRENARTVKIKESQISFFFERSAHAELGARELRVTDDVVVFRRRRGGGREKERERERKKKYIYWGD
jgi:hypothetical protein